MTQSDVTVNMNVPGLPAKATADTADLVPIWDAEAAAHRHVPVAGLPGSRSIVTPKGDDPAISMELPAAVHRRDFLLGFTATGAVTTTKLATAKDVDDIAARGMTTVDTIADLCASRRRAGGTVYVRGYHKPGDGGGGTFMWNGTSTEVPNKGTVFAVDGIAAGRWIKLYDQLVNIKAFGAKGDGKADDAEAVQRAVDSGLPLFVPPGTYRLCTSITWANHLTMVSPSEATFLDSRPGQPEEALFHRAGRYMRADGTWFNEIPGDPLITRTGPIILRNLNFKTGKPQGSTFEIQGAKQCVIERCTFISPFRCLTFAQASFDNTVIGCLFQSNFYQPNGEDTNTAKRGWGLMCSGHTFVYGCMANGCGTGMILTGVGNEVKGARIEQCVIGMLLGSTAYNVTGTCPSMMSEGTVSGVHFEANKIGLWVINARSTSVTGIGVQGSPYASYNNVQYRADSETGILIENAHPSTKFTALTTGNFFTRGALINLSEYPVHCSTAHISSGGGVALGGVNSPLCDTGSDPRVGYHFIRTQMSEKRTLTAFSDLMHIGLTGIDIRNLNNQGAVFSKNLGNVEVPINGAPSVAVVFSPVRSANSYAINTITLKSDETSQLSAGPCYYATTIVSRHSETGINYSCPDAHSYRTVSGGIGEFQRVYVTFHGGTPTGTIRRLYRGRKPGFFEGYWDLTASSFTDDGKTPFTGKAMPPRNGSSPSRIEDDANYQIVATPSWATTVYVTNKKTTGFTLNFGTAAPDGNQTVSWLMFRP